MLKVLEEFRDRLDAVMHKCMDRRIVLYGYGYSGKFVGWYAQYYHGIRPDYIITQDWSGNIPYEFELYRESLFDFAYRDVKNAVVWLCLPETKEISERLASHGYVKNKTYFNLCEAVYGSAYEEYVRGAWDVQPLTYLEHQYGCDFVTRLNVEDFQTKIEGMHPYVTSSPKEIFPLLDKCHCQPCSTDAIFDFGCGKGGAMLSFLDYGFQKVGGVEYEDGLYETLLDNFKKIGIRPHSEQVNCIHGDASRVEEALDAYNWFYFFDPFGREIFRKAIHNICESIKRNRRRAYIISINPKHHQIVEDTGCFLLTNQFDILTRQRVVDVFVTKREFEG